MKTLVLFQFGVSVNFTAKMESFDVFKACFSVLLFNYPVFFSLFSL